MSRWLLLHGVPTGGRYWERLDLPGEVVAPDIPGLGPAAGEARERPPERVDDPLPALRALLVGCATTTVVGVDFGAVLAARLAVEGRVPRLVLMSTALGGAWLPSVLAARPPLSGPFYRWSAGRRFLGLADPTGDLARAFPPDDGLADRMIGIARGIDIRVLRETRAELARRRIPSLCLWGESDPFFPPRVGRRLARQVGAEWRALPGRHALAWTAPEAVSACLREWVCRSRGALRK